MTPVTKMDQRTSELLEESVVKEYAGDIAGALRAAQEALELARAANDAEGICGGLAMIARVKDRLGHYEEACRLAQEALTYASDTIYSVSALIILGNYGLATGELLKGEAHSHRAADLSRQIGYSYGLASALHNLGAVYLARGKFDLSLVAALEASRMNEDYPAWIEPMVRAVIYQFSGDRQRARQGLSDLWPYTTSSKMLEACWYCFSARLALDEEDLPEAGRLLGRARSAVEKIGNLRIGVWVSSDMSRWRRLAGDPAAALTWAANAVAQARRAGNRLDQGWALIEQGRAAWEACDLSGAEESLLAAIEIHEAIGADYFRALATFLLAAFYHQHGRPEAASIWRQAVDQILIGGYAFILERERALAFPLVSASLSDKALRASMERLLERLANVPPLPLHIHGLDRFQVRQGRRPIDDRLWSRRRAGELFRFLLLQPDRAVAREVVLDALWPDHLPQSAEALFHKATSTLRRILEPDLPSNFPSRYLKVEQERIALNLPPGSTCDFLIFKEGVTQALQEGDPAALEQGLTEYSGELFPADRYADWAAGERERLAQLYLRGLLALADAHLAAGRPREALDASRRILANDPWQEEAALMGMRACLALGDRPGALRLYQKLEKTLRNELGIAPRPDLVELARSVMRET